MDNHADTIRRALQTVVDEFGPNVTDTPDIWDDAFSAVDALVAERQQAIDDKDEAEETLAKIHLRLVASLTERDKLKARCEQAIDALREAEDDLERILPPRGHEELAQGVYFAHKRIAAALVSLGEAG